MFTKFQVDTEENVSVLFSEHIFWRREVTETQRE